jgi:hypothetical protein
VDGFGWTSNATLPGPLPVWPLEIRTQESLAAAAHPQPLEVVTSTLLPPPVAAMARDVGLTT